VSRPAAVRRSAVPKGSPAPGLRRAGALAARLAALAALAGPAACAGGRPPPSADRPAPRPPDLAGAAIMVLPVQPGGILPGEAGGGPPAAELDAELAYWLAERGPQVRWVFPPQLERALARSPALQMDLRALAVAGFRRAELRTIGDPLFGQLRALGGLADARFALLPVGAAFRPASGGAGRLELAAALIDTVGGRVLWFGVVAGAPGPPDDPAHAARAAQALARTLFP